MPRGASDPIQYPQWQIRFLMVGESTEAEEEEAAEAEAEEAEEARRRQPRQSQRQTQGQSRQTRSMCEQVMCLAQEIRIGTERTGSQHIQNSGGTFASPTQAAGCKISGSTEEARTSRPANGPS